MKNEIEETIIFGESAYGPIPKRTFWTVLKARIWLKWFALRVWLARRGWFVTEITLEDGTVHRIMNDSIWHTT